VIVLEVVIPLPLNKNFYYLPPKDIDPEHIIGKRVKVQFGRRILISYVLSYKNIVHTSTFKFKKIIKIIDENPLITKETIKLANYISKNYICSLGEAFALIIPTTIKLATKSMEYKEIMSEKIVNKKYILSIDQINAVNLINKKLQDNCFANFLIHGVTASGKTEIYANAIKYALKQNKNIIMLVPEISLTIQFMDIMTEKFGQNICLWHSGISNIEKYRLFFKMKNNDIRIAIGARSAIFAPFENLGLIIIDEEHDQAYKQEQKPSYDAREIAKWRGKYHNAVVIFGSATPSLESYKNALEKKIILIELNERVCRKKFPEIKILTLENKPFSSRSLLPETIEAISKTLLKNEQIIVFLNRRGYSPVVMCKKCASVYQCSRCSIAMVFHKNQKLLKCHYCGENKKLPITCSICKSSDITIFGVGIQKVEDELIRLFNSAKIFRLDGDTAFSKNNYERAYNGIKNGEYDILLGTQMIAKGFDFPKVSLVCMVNADMQLYLPDFKAAERTFQLITQVAGRSGRGNIDGTVIVQTKHPQHYAIKYAKNHDFLSFYKVEIEQRRQLFYPPCCDIAKISIRDKNEKIAEKIAEKLSIILINLIKQYNLELKLLGPSSAYISKMNGFYRKHIIIKGYKENIIKLVGLSKNFKQFSRTFTSIEIMPSDLL
jgi:primosomal protein N' (replication factor Y)